MIKYAISLVMRRKLRTVLTSLGITISVVLVSLIIFGMQDLQRLLTNSFQEQFKSNEIFISNSAQFGAITGSSGDATQDGESITQIDSSLVTEIKSQANVATVQPATVIASFEATLEGYERPLIPTFISGWDIEGDDGYFSEFWGESRKPEGNNVFISTTFLDLYGIEDPESVIGKTVKIEVAQAAITGSIQTKEALNRSYEFTVVGVVDVGQDRNDLVMSLDKSLEILAEVGGFESGEEYAREIGYDVLRIQVKTDEAVGEVQEYLEESYNFAAVVTANDLLGFLDQIIGAFTLVLVVFGTVAGVVAAIGIMNTMVMSIYEQTKEIGIIKAMGASAGQIMWVFLIQSGIIGLLGGLVGLAIVFLAMKISDPFIVEALVQNGFQVEAFFGFDLVTTLVIMAISIVVGIGAGLYPALKAGALDPVKALRSE